MKHIYSEMPESLKGTYADYSRNFGFSWKEFVATVPSPLFLVTTYKSNGLPNACMQSWAAFTSADHGKGFYAILASVNKCGHLYQTLREQQEAVINFMSADYHAACMATIRNNAFEADEIKASGLTAEKASQVNAPVVKECFMNLECRYVWEKEMHIDEDHLEDRTGEEGLLYNIHYQMNPEHVMKTGHDYAAVLQKKIDVMEY